MPTPPLTAPLDCPSCLGNGYFGEYRKSSSQDCSDCRGTGHQRCEDCSEPATRTAHGDTHIKLCAECGEQSDRDEAEWLAEQPLDRLTNEDRTWLADREQAEAERYARNGEAWSGGFAENH